MKNQRLSVDHDLPLNTVNEKGSLYSDSNDTQTKSVVSRQLKFRKILKSVLTSEVIPRIFDASGDPAELPSELKSRLSDHDVSTFRHMVVAGEHDDCFEFVQAKIDSGLSLRSMCLGLFTLTARELGELWQRDELSFAEVTMGLGTLHLLVHQFSSRDTSVKLAGGRHNIILASAPSEQHAFGILVVSKIFEMEGWLVTGGPDMRTGEDLTSLVSKTWFDIIGLTASSEEGAYALAIEIERLRSASLNPDLRVMVGGNGFANNPSISRIINADELAMDAKDAIIKAQALLDEMQPAADEHTS